MDITITVYQPDGETLRESYTETLGTIANEEMTIRNIRVILTAYGRIESISYDIYKNIDDILTIKGDIIYLVINGTTIPPCEVFETIPNLRVGDNPHIESMTINAVNLGERTANMVKVLSETEEGGLISTNIQNVYNNIWAGTGFSGKYEPFGQYFIANASGMTILNYNANDNVLPSFNLSVQYNTPFSSVIREIRDIANGTLDLTSSTPFIWGYDSTLDVYTKQRSSSTLKTFDIGTINDDITGSISDSEDCDDYIPPSAKDDGIINEWIINNVVISPPSYYATAVADSKAKYGTRQYRIDDQTIDATISAQEEWVYGLMPFFLEPVSSYRIRAKKSIYAFSALIADLISMDGNIAIESNTVSIATVPLQKVEIIIDSSGVDYWIECGDSRPVINARRLSSKEILAGDMSLSNVSIFDPSDEVDQSTFQGIELKDKIMMTVTWSYQSKYPLIASNVNFIISGAGIYPFTETGIIKTITSTSTPSVVFVSSGNIAQFYCVTHNSPNTNQQGLTYGIGISGGQQLFVHAVANVTINGIEYGIETNKVPFWMTDKTIKQRLDETDVTVADHDDRLPAAEQEANKDWTSGQNQYRAQLKFFPTGSAPDGGGAGWFATKDNLIQGNWIRVATDQTGTPDSTFTINNDQSAGQYIMIVFDTDDASYKGKLRYDKTNQKFEISIDNGSNWTDLATGVSTAIEKIVDSITWRLEIETATGDLVFKDATSPAELFRVSTTGEITVQDDIMPITDDLVNIGAQDKRIANAYVANNTYTESIIFTSDGGDTVNAKIEWDGTNGKQFVENIAMGFQED